MEKSIQIYNKKLDNYLDSDGRLVQYPSKRPMRILALIKIVEQMEADRKYTEKEVISFSAKTGDGLGQLEKYVKEQFYLEHVSFNNEIYISNERQKQAVEESYASLMNVRESMKMKLGEDFYTIDLMNAYEQLGRVIGESVDDDLVDTIFKKFCMGK